MFKTRKKIAEEEAKKEEDYRPTKELESTSPVEKGSFPKAAVIIIGILVLLIIICVAVIFGVKR